MTAMKIFISITLLLLLLTSCEKEQNLSHSCDSHKKIENIKPAVASYQWTPFRLGAPHLFVHGNLNWQFEVVSEDVLQKTLQDSFIISCTEDSSKRQIVEYGTSRFANRLVSKQSNTEIQYFDVNAQAYLDENSSSYENVRWLTLLEAHAGLLQNDGSVLDVLLFQTPIQNNGFLGSIPSTERLGVVSIGNRTFKDVYTNKFAFDDLKVFYTTTQGIVGFIYKGKEFYLF